MKRLRLALLVVLICLPATVRAESVGVVAAVEGRAEIGRGGAWAAAGVGGSVEREDVLRTGRPGRLRLLFRDDSVLVIGDDSEIRIDENVFAPAQGKFQSLMQLVRGKVRAVVSQYYGTPGASYQVQTGTAVLGVRGTEFVARYDAAKALTEVVGISNHVEVRGVVDLKSAVMVGPHQLSVVAQGARPTPPRRLDDALFRQYLEGLELVGGGAADGLIGLQPFAAGSFIPRQDRAAALLSSYPALRAAGTVLRSPAVGVGIAGEDVLVPDANRLLGQSLPVVETKTGGQLGIDF